MSDLGDICEPARARSGRTGGRQARVAMRAAPLADDVRPVRAGMPGGQYKPLSEEGVRQIHEAALDALEQDVLKTANELGIGPMGFGGKTTLLGVKITAANRVPASYFVTVSYMCWAFRRQGVELNEASGICRWLY